MFMASLICNVDAECEKLLVCKMDLDCIKTLQFETEEKCNFGRNVSFTQEAVMTGSMRDISATSCMGKSPFPDVDKFVQSVASTGSVAVMYVVDLRSAAYYQKCHDPDCRGYRSPLRPIPIDAIPSPWVSTDSGQISNDMVSTDDCIDYQFPSIDENCLLLFSDKNITDSSVKDSWWLEVMRVADDVENKRNMVDP
ncbi:DNA-directed primase/polymerase protein isoform X2 [Cucumis melo var. makuwa]|uniref:DNA-directed primase/polymerase protein n=1 Tax=Cucumis melo var. makuwa TaxID=1194695 RepID=A0A5D3DH78_CUCMM|nr:DNA-directed primase/polymerase protein isoform X2 [Cucumis melo var. makuwa]